MGRLSRHRGAHPRASGAGAGRLDVLRRCLANHVGGRVSDALVRQSLYEFRLGALRLSGVDLGRVGPRDLVGQHLSIGRETGAFNLRLRIPESGSNEGLGVLPPSTVTQAARSSSPNRLGTAHVIVPMLVNTKKDGG